MFDASACLPDAYCLRCFQVLFYCTSFWKRVKLEWAGKENGCIFLPDVVNILRRILFCQGPNSVSLQVKIPCIFAV